ncbi:MAG: glycosyltransferase family 2 protein [Candidatus Binatia bacterium]
MYRDKRIALVIPAFNESRLIGPTLTAVPEAIDRIIVVDDASTDGMGQIVRELMTRDPRIELLRHETNRGCGAAIVTGYQHVLRSDADIAVVCGGDNQMPLEQVANLLDPIIDDEADYVKGNRFMRRIGSLAEIPGNMPLARVVGNMMITMLTKIASGYYKVADVVEGFTAINREGLERVDWERAWPGYGYPMDFLIRLNAHRLRVLDVPRRAIYLPGERQSQIKGLRYALRVSPMLLRGFFWRLWTKYILWDFHPLVFFFFLGLTLLPLGLLFGLFLVWQQLAGYGVSGPRAILAALLVITGLQSLLFAMLFDMEESR